MLIKFDKNLVLKFVERTRAQFFVFVFFIDLESISKSQIEKAHSKWVVEFYY